MVIIFVAFYILTALIVAVSVAGIAYGVGVLISKNKEATINNLKWIALCSIVVAVFLAMLYFSIPARAEELPEEFYYRVVFIDEIEELDEELLLHGDDANHLWSWYEEYPAEDEEFYSFEFDKELSNIALYWAQENSFFVKLDKEERIVRGRIVVLVMWQCTDNPYDDEVIDTYYTELVTQ